MRQYWPLWFWRFLNIYCVLFPNTKDDDGDRMIRRAIRGADFSCIFKYYPSELRPTPAASSTVGGNRDREGP